MSNISKTTIKKYSLAAIVLVLANYALGSVYDWYPTIEILILFIFGIDLFFTIGILKNGKLHTAKEIKHTKINLAVTLLVSVILLVLWIK